MKKIPAFLCHNIRGAIGKLFVIKHYKGGKIVRTKFPDMTRIVATDKQRVRRNLFKEAVVYAKCIIADLQRKEAFRRTLPKKKSTNVYQAAIQLYMRMQGDVQLEMSNRQRERGEWQLAISRKKLNGANKHLAIDNGVVGNKSFIDKDSMVGMHGLWPVLKSYQNQGPWKVVWKKRVGSIDVSLNDQSGFKNLADGYSLEGYFAGGQGCIVSFVDR